VEFQEAQVVLENFSNKTADIGKLIITLPDTDDRITFDNVKIPKNGVVKKAIK